MTLLQNSVQIQAVPEQVWQVLGKLDSLHLYDPGVRKSEILEGTPGGVGAARQCDLTPGGWFRERVTEWQPNEAIAFELFDCTLPVKRLKHRYTLIPRDGGTFVEQRMEYELKFGPMGKLMDAIMVRKKWNQGILGFFAGLKRFVESGADAKA